MKRIITLLILILVLIQIQLTWAKVSFSYEDIQEETAQTVVETTKPVKETTKAESTDSSKKDIAPAETTQKTETKPKTQAKTTTNAIPSQNLEEYNRLLAEYNRLLTEMQQNSTQANNPIGTWKVENNNWVFYDNLNRKVYNKWITYNNNTYYFDQYGYMAVGWKKIGINWYYFNKNGSMFTGWLEYNKDEWYYLDAETGKMADSDKYINGEFFNFNRDGKWIKNVDDYEKNDLAKVVNGMVKYVNNKTNLKNYSNVPSEYKKQVTDIINMLPKYVLNQLIQSCEYIYICMDMGEKNWIRSVSYKDEDGDRSTDYLPFSASKKQITIDGSNVYNLYYGIGCFLATNMKYQNYYISETAVWKTIFKNPNGELDELFSLSYSGPFNLAIYISDANTALSCAIGWYLLDPIELSTTNAAINKYVVSLLGRQSESPADYLNSKYN